MNVCDTLPPPKVGGKRSTALALSVMALDVVHRTTIRALLPAGHRRGVGGRINSMTTTFGNALREFERNGWVTRSGEWIVIHDREQLLDYAYHGEQDLPAELLDIAAGLLVVSRRPAAPADVDCRDRELTALRRLMQAPVPGGSRGRGRVRRVGVAGSEIS